MGDIREHRKQTRLQVIYRDAGLCTRHFYILNQELPGDHVHHVYGRSSKTDNYKEAAASQISLCVACHDIYRPLQKPSTDTYTEQELVLLMAVTNPIRLIISRRKEN